ncbi:MAG: TonB C-terminal domain-containing protein [Gemmatimonadaceae bacterium]
MSAGAEVARGIGGYASLGASVLLHAGLITAFLVMRPAPAPATPDFYRVNLVAAPSGERAVGVVTPTTTPVEATPPAPPRPKTDEVAPVPTKTAPRVADRRATPSVSEKRVARNLPAPVAGGGADGGAGTDVQNIRIEGIEFPFQGYLDNIVRQIALRFHPPRGRALSAEVVFLIRRDGSVIGVRFAKRSGSYTFDLEAQGAVESAASAFGPLPAGFRDDVLPVTFSFDPSLAR